MKSLFYNRTAYLLLNKSVPQCFMDLDQYFDTRFQTTRVLTHRLVVLAENLCRRMADLELYAQYISEVQIAENPVKASILIGTLLVGYFNACKSLLDAGAITLAQVYNLNLKNKDTDFNKNIFWKRLQEIGPEVHARYISFKPFVRKIVDWRDAAVHRITPFVICHSPNGPPMEVPREKVEIRMVGKPDVTIDDIARKPKEALWVEPLYYHRLWHSKLIRFCEEVCTDIQGAPI